MTCLLCMLAWMAFYCGVINLVYEATRYTTLFAPPEEAKVTMKFIALESLIRWIFASLMFTIWYYLLFI